MSLGGAVDYEQVLHLKQIDINSSITPNIRLELQIDGTTVNIRNVGSACWKANHDVEVSSTSDIALTVMTGHRPFRKEKFILVSGSDVWNPPSGFSFSILRSTTLNKQPLKATFEFCIPTTPGFESAFTALQKALDDAKGYRSLLGSSKLRSVDTTLKIGVALSEMDPFSKATFALARTVFDLLKEQQRYDDLALKLANNFQRILPFANIVARDFEMSETLQVIVEDLFDIVEKGAQFICQYVRRTSIDRFLFSLFYSEDREFIDDFQERLAKIIEDFDRATAVDTLHAVHDTRKAVQETQLVINDTHEAVQDTRNAVNHTQEAVHETQEAVNDTGDRVLLKEVLKPVDEATYNPDRGCFEGTRQDVLPKIFEWASDLSSPKKILWLYGMPGSGKTSVAASLCDILHTNKNLAASFFCRRDDPILSKPESLFRTLIYHLALTWGSYRKRVVNALRDDPKLRPNMIKRLIDELIAKPLATLEQHPTGTLVIVIDALDEYGDIETRRDLLSNLLIVSSIVSWLKVVITSRHDHDIKQAFAQLGSEPYDSLELDAASDTQRDIRLFAEKRLTSLGERRHIPNWPSEELLDIMTKRSGGLFISVQTMWLLIKDSRRPDQLLRQVLEGEPNNGAHDHLYDLYKSILNIKVGLEPQDMDDFRQVIGAIIAVADRRSLCDDTLAALLEMEPHVVKSMVDDVESLVYREGEGKVIRVRHLSIIDFLSGSSCPEQYRVDFQQVHAKLTKGCFITMTRELKFNICGFETSFLLNSQVTDMADRVDRYISDGLLYSCIHWASHLESTSECFRAGRASMEQVIQACHLDATSMNKLMEKEKIFLDEMLGYIQIFTRNQFLFWLEALSVLKQAGLATRMLSVFLRWIHDDALARDMLEFVAAFMVVISQSAPHIYLSALSFAPPNSPVSQSYKKCYRRTIGVQTGGYSKWPPFQRVLHGHAGPVNSTAFSHDSRLIASGSKDGTVRIWDSETGVGRPLEGHNHPVTSIAFSYDGKHIASGSDDRTVRVSDAENGKPVGESFAGHPSWVTSVAFSHDSKHIVSGSWDRTVRVWDAENGKAVGEPFTGHTNMVTSVAFSHDGKHIVSGSHDKAVRVWDAENRKAVGEPFIGHTGEVTSVAFSHDSKHVVSGSWDRTVRVWDVENGKEVGGSFTGHRDWVTSVAFSQDSKHIVSGSRDKTVRVWDAENGKAVGEPFTGHTNMVTSVAFSHDGKHIVSGSRDKTVRVWDAENGKAVGEPFTGHTSWVTSVAFSHDSKHIVSGSYDNTIRIFDAENGKEAGELLTGHTKRVTSVAFSHDGKHIVSGSWDKTVRVWDAENGKAVGESFTGHTNMVTSVAFSHDNKYIVSGSWDRTLRVWDAENGKAVGEPFTGHTNWVTSVAFSHDSKHIASGSWDRTVRVWDAENGKAVGEPFTGHTSRVTSVAFSHDSKYIVSGSWDRTVRIWDAENGKAVGESFTGHTHYVSSVAFSHDSKHIVSGSYDYTIRIWDAENRKTVGEPFTGHTDCVTSVAFSHDGQHIVSGSWDNTVRIWDIENGKAVGEPLQGHTDYVPSVAFSHDSRHIVSGSTDGTVRVWDTEGVESIISPHRIHYSKFVDGWVVDANSRLLFWAPPQLRPGLLIPGTKLIISRSVKTTLDLTSFAYGDSWTLCRDATDDSEQTSSPSLRATNPSLYLNG